MKENNISLVKKHYYKLILFSLLAIVVLAAVFYLPAKQYDASYPPLGNDFYHSFNLINFVENNLSWPQASWRYIWHFGGPALIAYPWLNFYLVQPVIHALGFFKGTIFYFLGCLFLYGLFAYYLFYRLSKSLFLSLGLAVALFWSASTWRLIAAGSLTLTANQFFLALTLLLAVIYLQNKKRKYLLLSGLTAGLSVVSQSGSGFPFIIPLVFLFLVGAWGKGEKFWSGKRKIIDGLLFLLISLLVSSFYVYYTLVNVLSSREGFEVFDWMKAEAFSAIVTKTNPMIFLLLGVLFIAALFFKRLKSLKTALPILIGMLYLSVFNLASIFGLNPFGADLAPPENWYVFTLFICMLAAVFWRVIFENNDKIKKGMFYGASISALFLLVMPFGLYQTKDLLTAFNKTNMVCGAEKEEYVHEALVKNDYAGLKQSFPAWFDGQDINHRFFSLSWCVDLWFNSFYSMPLTGGYDTLLINKEMRNYISWTNDIFTDSMNQRGVEPEIIKNNILFQVDWLAGRYLEKIGDFSYLQDADIFQLDNQPAGYRVYEFQPEITSPLVKATRVPAVLIVSGQDGYDTLLRVFAQENLNSRYLIPVQGPEYLEDIKLVNLSDFDAVFLYDYHYKHEKSFHKYPTEPWQHLAAYVKNGGRLFLETGSEVKESDIKNLPVGELPEVFPVKKTAFGELGAAWQLTSENQSFLSGVETKNFSPLIYNDSAWKLSYAQTGDIRSNAQALLSQEGQVILASYALGRGQVYWSGLTLPYHIKTYSNLEESQLFRKILDDLVGIKDEGVLSYDFSRPKSEKIEVSGRDFSGVLFKENINPGWQAKVNGEKAKIYKTALGFMYTRIPAEKIKNGITVNFDYRGQPSLNILFYLSLLTIALVVAYCFVEGKINFKKKLGLEKTKKKLTKWWEKDEEAN